MWLHPLKTSLLRPLFQHPIGRRNNRLQRRRHDIRIDACPEELAARMLHLDIGDSRSVRAMLQRMLGIVIHRQIDAEINRQRIDEPVD